MVCVSSCHFPVVKCSEMCVLHFRSRSDCCKYGRNGIKKNDWRAFPLCSKTIIRIDENVLSILPHPKPQSKYAVENWFNNFREKERNTVDSKNLTETEIKFTFCKNTQKSFCRIGSLEFPHCRHGSVSFECCNSLHPKIQVRDMQIWFSVFPHSLTNSSMFFLPLLSRVAAVAFKQGD